MTLVQAIADYHALLDPKLAAVSWQCLTEEMRARRLYFGERPLATVLRPRLMTMTQYELLQRGTQQVAEAARSIVAAALADDEVGRAVREVLMLTPLEERLIAMPPGYLEPSAHSRMDTFLTVDGSSLQFVEYNAESPAAIAYEDLLAQAFLSMPVMQEFSKRYSIMPLPARQYMLRTLLDCWRTAGSPGHEPRL